MKEVLPAGFPDFKLELETVVERAVYDAPFVLPRSPKTFFTAPTLNPKSQRCLTGGRGLAGSQR